MSNDAVASGLSVVLADSIVFYHKLHNYHWYVTGKLFFSLHAKFEELYDHFADVVDDVAERMLTIGAKPHPTLASALEAATIKEETGSPSPEDMVKILKADMLAQRDQMLKVIEAAEAADDRGTANLLDDFCDEIEKTCWMIDAWLS